MLGAKILQTDRKQVGVEADLGINAMMIVFDAA